MKQAEMLAQVRDQLARDLNCAPEDFDTEGFVFTEARDTPGRRPFPREARHFEMLTMGGAVVVCASGDLLPLLRRELEGKSRDEAFNMPFVVGNALYYLPDKARRLPLLAEPSGCWVQMVEGKDILALYAQEGFHNAMGYDIAHPWPDVLVAVAHVDKKIAGMAGASADCEMLWQVGVDVLPEYRGRGLAALLVTRLGREVQKRGKIPYYGTSSANVASQRVAHRSGFAPTWACTWRGRFDGEMTLPGC